MADNQVSLTNSSVSVSKNLETGGKASENNQNSMQTNSSSIPKEAKAVLFPNKNNLIAMKTHTIDKKTIEKLSLETVNTMIKNAYYFGRGLKKEEKTFCNSFHPNAKNEHLKKIATTYLDDNCSPSSDVSYQKAKAVSEKIIKEGFKVMKVDGNKVYLEGTTPHNFNLKNKTYQVMEAIIITKLNTKGSIGLTYLIDDIVFK